MICININVAYTDCFLNSLRSADGFILSLALKILQKSHIRYHKILVRSFSFTKNSLRVRLEAFTPAQTNYTNWTNGREFVAGPNRIGVKAP